MSTIGELLLRYSDVNARFTIKNNSLVENGIEAINNSIENILGTTPGERVFRPDFGSYVKSLLFEPLNDDNADLLLVAISNAISKWEPRVEMLKDESYVKADIENGLYDVLIVYKLVDIGVNGEFEASIKP